MTTITCTNNKGKKKIEKTVTKLAPKMSVVTEFEENEVIWEGGRENYVRQFFFLVFLNSAVVAIILIRNLFHVDVVPPR